MPFDPNAPDLLVGVVGTGSMGRGIMQVSAQGGMRVIAYDEKPGAAEAAKAYIGRMLDGAVEKGRVPAAGGESRARPHHDRLQPRGCGQGQPDRGGHHRAARCQAGPVRQARRSRRPRHHHRLQHLLHPDHRHRLGLQASRARRRHALLQSRAADAARGDHPRPQDGAVGERGHDGAGPPHDARAGALHRQPRLPRQPRGPRLRAGGAAPSHREHRHGGRDRPHPHRRAGLQARPLRARRPGRHRRAARRDGIGLRALLQRACLRPLPHRCPARRRRAARPEDGRGLVHVPGRQAHRAAASARPHGAAQVRVGPAQRAPPRAAGAADRSLPPGRRHARDDRPAQRGSPDRAHADRLGPHHGGPRPEARSAPLALPSTCCSASRARAP